mgnify:CR=1 FL=1
MEQAGQKIRSTGLQMALILFGLGILVCGASVGFFIWSTDSLREERNALKVAIQAEETTLATLRSQTWGVRLHEGGEGTFHRVTRGDEHRGKLDSRKECRYPAGEEMKRPGEVFSVMSLGAFSSSQRRIKKCSHLWREHFKNFF